MACAVCSKSDSTRSDYEEIHKCYSNSGRDQFGDHVTKIRYVARCRTCKALYDVIETTDYDFSYQEEIDRTPITEEEFNWIRKVPPSFYDHGLINDIPKAVSDFFDVAEKLGKGALIGLPRRGAFASLYSVADGRLVFQQELTLPPDFGPAQMETLAARRKIDSGKLGGGLVWSWDDGFSVWSEARCEFFVSQNECMPAEGPTFANTEVKEVVTFMVPDWTLRGVQVVLKDGRKVDVGSEKDLTPDADPTYDYSSLMMDAAWVDALATALGAYLKVPVRTKDWPTTPTSI